MQHEMDVVGHERIAIKLDGRPVKLCFGQDACAQFTDTFLWRKDELAPKCLRYDMIRNRWVDIAGVTDLFAV